MKSEKKKKSIITLPLQASLLLALLLPCKVTIDCVSMFEIRNEF